MEFQIRNSISSDSAILHRFQQDLSIPYGRLAANDRYAISGFDIDKGTVPYHSNLQRRDLSKNVDILSLSAQILQHRYDDDLQGNTSSHRVVERITNNRLHDSSLASKVLTHLRHQVNADALRFRRIVGLTILEQRILSDLTSQQGVINDSPSTPFERIHPYITNTSFKF